MDGRLAVWRSVLALAYLQTGHLDEALRVAEEGCQNDDRIYIPKVVVCAVRIARNELDDAVRGVHDVLRVKPDLSQREVFSWWGRCSALPSRN